ncbi:hypothetical protein Fmac_016236 [Flemingia macrophylla]|uniref:PORR domain-containing protein n=1 Tax=Flemingia macrophylla TaxID=520843 RepID=A0ABD1MGU1_9FABA
MALPRSPRLLCLFSQPHPHSRCHQRSIYEGTFKAVRDRGLEHAVEREKNLKPLLSLKNLIANEPSKSLPLSLLKRSPELPFRPADFIRRYPSFFHEFLPTAAATLPHLRLTPEALALHADELLLHQSDQFKHRAADNLLKLLMIARVHKLPLTLLHRLRWHLGLPPDLAHSLVPDFPDYFRATAAGDFLELVCWSHDLAVSVLQNRYRNRNQNGESLVFPVQFSNGFEMDKKYERWLREWQRLPYVSPYEDASHLRGSGDEYDRWVVGVLHEILHVFVGKKVERDCLFELGEWLGLRSRFKRAILQHPGIFYVSSKTGTYTVVLREGYRRGSLVEDHPVMSLRNRYVHLMNSVREEGIVGKVVQAKGGVDESEAKVDGGGGEGGGEMSEGEVCEVKDASEMDVDDGGDDDGDKRSQRGDVVSARGYREFGKVKLHVDKHLRDSGRGRSPLKDSYGERSTSRDRGRYSGKMKLEAYKPLRDSRKQGSDLGNFQRERSPLRDSRKEKSIGITGGKNSMEVSKRRQVRGASKDVKSTQQRSRSSGSRGRSLASKKAPVL